MYIKAPLFFSRGYGKGHMMQGSLKAHSHKLFSVLERGGLICTARYSLRVSLRNREREERERVVTLDAPEVQLQQMFLQHQDSPIVNYNEFRVIVAVSWSQCVAWRRLPVILSPLPPLILLRR